MANHMRTAKAMEMVSSWIRLLLVLLILIVYGNSGVLGGKNARIHIPDELDDVVDDEEDEAWKEWGQKKKLTEEKFDPPPVDFSEMDLAQMQEEMMKRQHGPSFGFVKLRLGVRRTPDVITDIAMKWSKIARTGAIEVKFMGVDVSTIMFTLEKGQDTLELKDFILSQPEAYEMKIGDRLFRRPGDPPFDDVFAELHGNDEGHAHPSINDHEKDEL
ncbi:LRP chaperone MESD-like [Cynara cardunculus var. scolymus]|nr:LRP chaperone MESD-like [Cynara cardunculus var. scolymus]